MSCDIFVLKALPETLVPEVKATFEKTFDFFQENPQGSEFQRAYDKTLYRVYVYYERFGTSTWKMTVTSRDGDSLDQTLVTSVLNDGAVEHAVFDFNLRDDILKINFELVCGTANIIMIICEAEPGGEAKK